MKRITSPQNPLIKSLVLLQEKARARKQSGMFLIEGIREISLAIKGEYTINSILYNVDLHDENYVRSILHDLLVEKDTVELIEISSEVYQKLAYRESTEGIIAVAKSKEHNLNQLQLPENPLVLVMESIEKPGNIGAILRTCDAAKVDAVIIANPLSDLYNPNIIRSSVGCVFTNTIALASTDEAIQFLKEKNINIYSLTLQNSNPYFVENFKTPTALVVGTESTGLSEAWRINATQNIVIPMQGEIDSMNVSVASAITVFEAKRQRGFN